MRYKLINPVAFNRYLIAPDEIFLDITPDIIPGVRPYYMISNYGRVFHKPLDMFLRPAMTTNGYLFVSLATENGQKLCRVHRLLMLVHYPIQNPDKFKVNHKDGEKTNCYYDNLEWTTSKGNTDHALRTGLMASGEDCSYATITNDQAIRICELLATRQYTNQQIANIIGCGESVVSHIKQGNTWKSISKDYDFGVSRPGKIFTEETIRKVCEYFSIHKKNESQTVNSHCAEALMACGIEPLPNLVDSCRKLYTRKYYTSISKDYNF